MIKFNYLNSVVMYKYKLYLYDASISIVIGKRPHKVKIRMQQANNNKVKKVNEQKEDAA